VSDSITILVVDDHPLFRQGVVNALGKEPGLTVLAETDSGEQALELARRMLPDVVLLDISMPGWDGIMTAEKMAQAGPAPAKVKGTLGEQ
jgi:DNA-binding NarL/FixJ family response regulator